MVLLPCRAPSVRVKRAHEQARTALRPEGLPALLLARCAILAGIMEYAARDGMRV